MELVKADTLELLGVGEKKDKRQAAKLVSSGLRLPCLYSEGVDATAELNQQTGRIRCTEQNQQTRRIILMCDQLHGQALQLKPTNKNCIGHWA